MDLIIVVALAVWGLVNLNKYRETEWYFNWRGYLNSIGKVGMEEIPVTLFYLPCVVATEIRARK